MEFWLKKGIDGFRMDAFQFVAKDTTFPPLPEGYEKKVIKYYGMGPHIHDYLQEMNREVISKYDIMTVSEGAGSTLEDAMSLVNPDRHELNMAYHFEGMDIGNEANGYRLSDFKKVYSRWDSAFAEKGWVSIFLGNHDVPRMVSKFGNDSPRFKEASSKMLTTFILSMRGTPYYYNGDELGMANIRFNKIEDYRDIAAINGYKNVKNKGGDLKAYIETLKRMSRDNSRTPFQWNNTANAGFTTASPWLKVNPDYITVNAAAQEKDPNSVLNYFKKMVKLRKALPELVYGKYELIDRNNEKVYAYTRTLDNKKVLVLLNFSTTPTDFTTLAGIGKTGQVLINNLSDLPVKTATKGSTFTLQPYQAAIVRLN
jgi:oligo-1,6-glucosidase